MTTYAQVIGNRAYNIFIGVDLDSALAGKVNPEWVKNEVAAGRNWSAVTDGVKNGAEYIGGVWVNPVVPVVYKLISKTAFMDHVIKQVGSIGRYMQIFEGCRDSTDAIYGSTLRYAYERYQAAIDLDLAIATPLFDVMLAAGVVSSTERNNVVNNWPSE